MTQIRNQKGQGLVEYMILLALVVFVCVGATKTLGKTLSERFTQMNKTVTQQMKIKINP